MVKFNSRVGITSLCFYFCFFCPLPVHSFLFSLYSFYLQVDTERRLYVFNVRQTKSNVNEKKNKIAKIRCSFLLLTEKNCQLQLPNWQCIKTPPKSTFF